MPGFYLTNKAKADVKDIARYTQKVWGREQRNNYLAMLDQNFHDLAKKTSRGHSCDEIRPGYRRYRAGKHMIFYRSVASDLIEVVRVLHGRMDFERHLPED